MSATFKLIGNVGSQPETRGLPSGTLAAVIVVYTHRSVKTANGTERRSQRHRVDCYGQLARRAIQLKPGELVQVTGYIQEQSWEQDGEKRYRTALVALQIVRVDYLSQTEAAEGADENADEVDVENLPF